MPYTENSIIIRGNAEDIFNCVLELENWPAFIPSIKHSRIIGTHEGKELHEMSSRIYGIKSSWKSCLVALEPKKRINYKQLKGFCDEMEGEWILKEQAEGVHVTLTHDFEFNFPILDRCVVPILKKYVIRISDCILEGIKSKIERENRNLL